MIQIATLILIMVALGLQIRILIQMIRDEN